MTHVDLLAALIQPIWTRTGLIFSCSDLDLAATIEKYKLIKNCKGKDNVNAKTTKSGFFVKHVEDPD